MGINVGMPHRWPTKQDGLESHHRIYWTGETKSTCFKRRTHAANRAVADNLRWSKAWRRRLTQWIDHLKRHPESWIMRLLRTRNLAWLQQKRSNWTGGRNGRCTIEESRTDTRLHARHVAKRYESDTQDFIKLSSPNSFANSIQTALIGTAGFKSSIQL